MLTISTALPADGWWPLVALDHSNRSLCDEVNDPKCCHHCRGELPLHTFYSPELPQRNFFKINRLPIPYGGVDSAVVGDQDGFDGLESFSWTAGSSSGGESTILVANFTLSDSAMPSLASQPVYFALHWRPAVNGSSLSLMIDAGDGSWQFSNVTGLVCNVGCG
eukprot:SAG22_NODE_150_length_17426_cov_8.082588_9_plen_164_part_00